MYILFIFITFTIHLYFDYTHHQAVSLNDLYNLEINELWKHLIALINYNKLLYEKDKTNFNFHANMYERIFSRQQVCLYWNMGL